MKYLHRIQNAIDYIEAHLHEDITSAQVAKAAAISQWHFQRIFKALTKETVKTYIRCRRMAHALDRLLHSKDRIIDIAGDAGYDTQESFTRAFKKMFGMTPNQFRKVGEDKLFLKKIKLDGDYLAHVNENLALTPEILTLEKRSFLGLPTSFYGPDSEKNNIGNKLPDLWAAFIPRMAEVKNTVGDIAYGIVRQTKEQSDYLEYYAALEVTNTETVPEEMVAVHLPKTTYAKFTHKGKPELLEHTVNYIYANWLLQSGAEHSYAADLEFYGPEYIPDSDQSLIHYAIPLVS